MGRPVEVTAIAVLAFIAGWLGLIATIAFIAVGDEIPPATTLGGLAGIAALILSVYALLSLVLAYGAWNLRPWAWPFGLGLEMLGVVNALLQYAYDPRQLQALIISLAIAGVILGYLLQSSVRQAFGRR